MKIYVVVSPYLDAEGGEHFQIDAVFLTKDLAQEYVDFEIGCHLIEEHDALEALPQSTANTKKKVEDGAIKIIKTKSEGNIFRFANQDKK